MSTVVTNPLTYGTAGTQVPQGDKGQPAGTLAGKSVTYDAPGKTSRCTKVMLAIALAALAYFTFSLVADETKVSLDKYALEVVGALVGGVITAICSLGIVSCICCTQSNHRSYKKLSDLLMQPIPTDPVGRQKRIEDGIRLYAESRAKDPNGELFRRVMIDEKGLAWYLINNPEFCTGNEIFLALNLRVIQEGKTISYIQMDAPNPYDIGTFRQEIEEASRARQAFDTETARQAHLAILPLIANSE